MGGRSRYKQLPDGWKFGSVGGSVGKSAGHYSETLEEVRCLQQTNCLEGLPRKASKV
jgi:hypothetical protein